MEGTGISDEQGTCITVPVISPTEVLEGGQVLLELPLDIVQRVVAGEAVEPVAQVVKELLFGVEHKTVSLVHHQFVDAAMHKRT